MQESPFYRYVFPVVWIAGCLTFFIGAMALTYRFLGGLCYWLGLSHIWVKPSWQHCFIQAFTWTGVYIVTFIVVAAWKKLRLKTASALTPQSPSVEV